MTFTLDELGQRLRDLPITRPDADSVVTNVMRLQRVPATRPRPLARVMRPIAAALVGLVGLWGVFYFSPATGAVLAGAPGVGSMSAWVLDYAGLGTGSYVTAQDAAAAHSGVTVRLIGASANSLRTVLLLRVSPANYTFVGGNLTDQFTTSYDMRGGYGDSRTGDWAVIFAPPSFVAMALGMRFTLTFDGFEGGGAIVVGTWSLSGTVLSHQGRSFTAPQPAALGGVTITFSSGTEADGVLELTAHLTGVTADQLGLGRKQRPGEVAPLTVTMADSTGTQLEVPYSLAGEPGGLALDILAYGVSDRGTYTLTISIQGVGSVVRSIVLR